MRQIGVVAYKVIREIGLRNLEALVLRWLPDGVRRGREYVARNPRRADKSQGSFSINLDTGVWADFAVGVKGCGVIDLYAYLTNQEVPSAANDLAEMFGVANV